MPATELETGTKLRLEDLAAACRQAHGEIAAVVEDVEESEPGDSPDEDSDVEPVWFPGHMRWYARSAAVLSCTTDIGLWRFS